MDDTTSVPEVTPTTTYGTCARGDRSSPQGGGTVELTGPAQVEGEATVTAKIEVGSTLLQAVEQARTALRVAGQLQANGAGGTGRSSPDASAPVRGGCQLLVT